MENVIQAIKEFMLSFEQYIMPFSLIAGGLFIGILFEKIIFKKLVRLATKTKWEGDDLVINAFRGIVILWFFIAGIYGAIFNLPIGEALFIHIKKFVFIIFIFSATIVIARITVGFIKLYTSKIPGVLPTTSIFTNITKLIVFVIGMLIIMQSLGISITPILTALGVGGLAVALALQETLSNLFSGFHIIVARNVMPGDYIKLDSGEEGYVTDITWRNTTMRALPNNIIIVPNSKLASAIITNFNQPDREMAVLVQVGVSYDSDLTKVEKVTIEVGKKVMEDVTGGISQFEPFIRYHTFDDFSINFTVILRVREFVDQYLIKHEFVKRLHKRYEAEGIEIPFPIRTVHMKDVIRDS